MRLSHRLPGLFLARKCGAAPPSERRCDSSPGPVYRLRLLRARLPKHLLFRCCFAAPTRSDTRTIRARRRRVFVKHAAASGIDIFGSSRPQLPSQPPRGHGGRAGTHRGLRSGRVLHRGHPGQRRDEVLPQVTNVRLGEELEKRIWARIFWAIGLWAACGRPTAARSIVRTLKGEVGLPSISTRTRRAHQRRVRPARGGTRARTSVDWRSAFDVRNHLPQPNLNSLVAAPGAHSAGHRPGPGDAERVSTIGSKGPAPFDAPSDTAPSAGSADGPHEMPGGQTPTSRSRLLEGMAHRWPEIARTVRRGQSAVRRHSQGPLTSSRWRDMALFPSSAAASSPPMSST